MGSRGGGGAGGSSRSRSGGVRRGLTLVAVGAVSLVAYGLDPGRAGGQRIREAHAEDQAPPEDREDKGQVPLRKGDLPHGPGEGQALPHADAQRKHQWLDLVDTPGGGARIARIDGSSPAAALLRKGDRVVAADGRRIQRARELEAVFASLDEGAPVLLEIVRGGKRRFVGVQLDLRPQAQGPAPQAPAAPQASAPAPAAPTVVVQIISPPPPIVVRNASEVPSVVVLGGDGDLGPALRPPAFSAPGLARVPGATFPPGPGTSAYAYPQIPGVAQPPGFPR